MGYASFVFILLGFCFGKIVSLLYTLEEAYVFAYVVFLMKIINEKRLQALKAYLYRRYYSSNLAKREGMQLAK